MNAIKPTSSYQEHKKYISLNIKRLTREQQLSFIRECVIDRGYKHLLCENSDGLYLNMESITDGDIIKEMYLFIVKECRAKE